MQVQIFAQPTEPGVDKGADVRLEVSQESLDQVRLAFNPSGAPDVFIIKALAAALITAISTGGKDGRTKAIARTAAEEASMWGVKSATTGKE